MTPTENAESRRGFLKKVSVLSLLGGMPTPSEASVHTDTEPFLPPGLSLTSLSPDQIFTVIDLEKPELKKVKQLANANKRVEALDALLTYYKSRFPKKGIDKTLSATKIDTALKRAADLEKNTFQWGHYAPAAYAEPIDWGADPAKDIEWVAAINRFFWVTDLKNAYQHTRDERYAKTFVRLTSDWISKNALEKTLTIQHPNYAYWKGYPWLDLQTGIRATNLCDAFRVFVHSPTLTSEYLGLLLASLYDHQQKTLTLPMNKIHNKAVFEQRGFVNVIHTFPEFKGSREWLTRSMQITHQNLMAQTTPDGVQREWAGGYHFGVYRDFMEIEERYHDLNAPVPENYSSRVRKMANYMFYIATPELGFPMFGNSARPTTTKREEASLHAAFLEASKRFGDPKFEALAQKKWSLLPKNGSEAFKKAGFYVFRNKWSEDQVYMALHCSPPGTNPYHDQQDNGTFELYAYGKWLMPDTGYYLYGQNNGEREWHRKTYRHPTLTIDRKDTTIAGQFLHWNSTTDQDVLCVENQSHYPSLLHRRTVWFADKAKDPFFVILDEAIGDVTGDLEIHFPLAPGDIALNTETGTFRTQFEDANLQVRVFAREPLVFKQEAGWTSDQYGKRTERQQVSASYKGTAPFSFISILTPYKGVNPPDCQLITKPDTWIAGSDPVEVEVRVNGKTHRLTREA
jgi:heparan-sulfate lyase